MTDAGGNVTSYSYDALNRLTGATTKTSGGATTASYSYGFDGAGNRTTYTANGTAISYQYNAANELTQSAVSGGATTTYTYDANGNLTGSSAGQTPSYNAKNQTAAINGVNCTYTGVDQTERTQAEATSYVNSWLGVSSQTSSGVATYYTRDNRGALVDERTSSGAYYYLFDGQGSVVGLTDGSGTLAATYAYDPYGTVTNSTGGSVADGNPWRFQSSYFDGGTSLYKFGTRYDDPTLGRWTQQDPVGGSLGNPRSGNRYVCTEDDPVNLTDPSGAVTGLGCGLALAAGIADTVALASTLGTAIGPSVFALLAVGGPVAFAIAGLTIIGAAAIASTPDLLGVATCAGAA